MWKEGKIEVYGITYFYWIKVYEERSEFGIDGGRVSKITIRRNGKEICNYDRGWDIKPTDANDKLALELVLHSEN